MKKKHNKASDFVFAQNIKISIKQYELIDEHRDLIEGLKNGLNMKALYDEEQNLLYLLQDVHEAINEAKNVMQNLEESRVFITEEFAE